MKRYSLVIAAFSAMAFLASCGMNVLKGEGAKSNQARTVAAFDEVDARVSTDIKINVVEGAIPGLVLSGYNNVMKHVKTEVKGNTLLVAFDLDDTWQVDDDDLKVTITVPSLRALSMSGAPDADIHGNLKGSEFKLDMSGASEVVIDNMNVDNFMADMSGKAELTIKAGLVKNAAYELSGIGSIEAYPLQTEETSASISGAGGAEVWATKKLEASISGAGSIKYKGTPEVIKHISGAGSVSAADN